MSWTSLEDCKQSGLNSFFRETTCDRYHWSGHFVPTPEWTPLDDRFASVWIGTLSDTKEFEQYLEHPGYDEEDVICPLWDDLGFEFSFESLQAFFCHKKVSLPQLAGALQELTSAADDIVENLKRSGFQNGNTVIVCYGIDLDRGCELAFGCLRFMGSFQILPTTLAPYGGFIADEVWTTLGK